MYGPLCLEIEGVFLTECPESCQFWQDDFRKWLCFEKSCQKQFAVQKLCYWELTAAAAVAANSSSAI